MRYHDYTPLQHILLLLKPQSVPAWSDKLCESVARLLYQTNCPVMLSSLRVAGEENDGVAVKMPRRFAEEQDSDVSRPPMLICAIHQSHLPPQINLRHFSGGGIDNISLVLSEV